MDSSSIAVNAVKSLISATVRKRASEMPDPSKSIFLDLEIDVNNMITDQDQFAKDVYAAADSLLNVLNSKHSLKGAQNEVEHSAKLDAVAKSKAEIYFKPFYEEIYGYSEDVELNELYHLIKEAKDLVRDLELQFHSRSRNQMIMNSPNTTDKRLAHDQYMRLRTAFDAFREFAKLLNDKVYTPLQAKSGNYGADSATTYPSYRYDGQAFNNYRAVARLLGWNPDEFMSHSDFTERLELEGVTDVEVVQVTL